jgi:hypothetical protein
MDDRAQRWRLTVGVFAVVLTPVAMIIALVESSWVGWGSALVLALSAANSLGAYRRARSREPSHAANEDGRR